MIIHLLILNIPQLCAEVHRKKLKALKLWNILGFHPQIYAYRRQYPSGRVGSETTSRAQVLSERLEIDPDIRWSRTGRIQLNEEVTVTLTLDMDIGFGGLGSFPIELTAQASGRSEVYWK